MKSISCFSKLSALLVVFIFTLGIDVAGQTVEEKLRGRTISGGVVNGKAKTLPKPEYPESARKAGIVGQVKVQVLIDESGNVVSAKAVDGVEDTALRQASEAAAMQATFSPTTLAGQPAKVSGVITYNFVNEVSKNEEKLKLMSLSAFLTVAQSFSDDAEMFRGAFEGEDILGEMIADLPQFSTELREVANFDRLKPEERVRSINAAIAAVRSKVATESDRWLLDVGVVLGELLGPMMFLQQSGGEPSELAKLDEAEIKGNLSKLGGLAEKPPHDFPKDILDKLTDLSALAQRNKILQGENLEELGRRVIALIDTIVPPEDETTRPLEN